MELRRHGLDHLAHDIELLAPISRAARHVLQAHHQARALQIVGKVGIACRVCLGVIDNDGALRADCVALDDHGGFCLAHVLHDHGHQHFTHKCARAFEVAHHVRQRLVGLLHLGLLLHAAGRCAASATESPCCCRIDTLDGLAGIGQHVQLLLVHLIVALYGKACARLRHVGRV